MNQTVGSLVFDEAMNRSDYPDRIAACQRADSCHDWGVPTPDQPFIAVHLIHGDLLLTADAVPTSSPTRNVAIERRQDESVYLWAPDSHGHIRQHRMDVDGVPAGQLRNISLATRAFLRQTPRP